MPKHYHESGGYATEIEAGLGGRVIKVINLNSSGPGSLRDALGQSGKRLIVFEVGGVIEEVGGISNGDVTVAGQTAPYPGITIIKGTMWISASNVVVSHIAVRLGDTQGEADCIEITGNNVVMDHVISTWGVDETLTLKETNNITLFKCIVAEALSHSVHEEGEHSKGTLIFRICDNISIIGCLYAHNRMRNPRIADSRVVMINSVVYDPAPGKDDDNGGHDYFVHLGDNGEQPNIPEVTFIGNVGLHGPDTEDAQYLIHGHKEETGKAYMEDNIIQDRDGNDLTIHDQKITPLNEPPLWNEGMEPIPAHESLYEVLRTVGPQPGQREDVTKRIVRTVADGTGGIINSQNDVGGYPDYPETRRPLTVPDGVDARRAWLDSLEDEIAVDKDIDLSRLYNRVGSQASDKLRPGNTKVAGSKPDSPGMEIIQRHSGKKQFHAALTLPVSNTVGITIFDLAGNVAAHQPKKYFQAGHHQIVVDVRQFPAGLYLCRFQIGKTRQSSLYYCY